MTDAHPTRFQRVMFASLWPALLLPVIGATLAFWVQPSPPDSEPSSYGWIGFYILGVFFGVLLWSMNLNAWLLTRSTANLATRSIPRGPGYGLVALYGSVAVWLVTLYTVPLASGVFWVLAPVTAIESLVVFVLVLATRKRSTHGVVLPSPSRGVKGALILYVVVAVAGTAYAFTTWHLPYSEGSVPLWIPLAVALGLPWSPTVVVITWLVVVGQFITGLPGADGQPLVWVIALVAPVVVNIIIALGIAVSPRSRAIALRVLFPVSAMTTAAAALTAKGPPPE